MAYHPFDTPSPLESGENSATSLTTLHEDPSAGEPLSPLDEEQAHEQQQQQQQPLWRPDSPSPDNIIRAASPLGRRYLKPVNGIQIKGFARSAQRRSSVLTLGSIERLQHYYAKKELAVNKIGTLGFKFAEEPEAMDDQPLTPQQPPPSWKELDVETDLDVLLQHCFQDIQQTLTAWAMVTGPRMSLSDHSVDSDTSEAANHGTTTFQILPLLQSVTKMLNSVKTYTMNRHDLSDYALSQLRHSSLSLLSAMKDLESLYRLDEEEPNNNNNIGTTPNDDSGTLTVDQHGEHDNGYIYRASDFHHLDKERMAIHHYLSTVEKHALNPPHHLGGPPAAFTDEIKALMVKTASGPPSPVDEEDESDHYPIESKISAKANLVPVWLERGSFVNDEIGRYHSLLIDHCAENTHIPDPHQDEDAFWQFLADGNTLCHVYNNIVKRSRRPFGFINKIHEDTRRTYRVVENLRFFAAACKFRFELVFDPFDPTVVARKTEQGLSMLEKAVGIFCQSVIQELRQTTDAQLCDAMDQSLNLHKK
ncbi:hypothetical protein BCR42DRAFT_405835 [Absidia repens]|uniref:Calponin-homology (CH) domain-containing protein n=1 Tax=Absidia repens TaxID=90262 RepID=A0A1X2IU24_9FUNG|nr:hypothetical protein BCR42DRAFT_405835 [Absidia repens]